MNDEHLELLRRIAKDVADIKAALGASAGAAASALGVQTGGTSGGNGAGGGVASDRELDGERGDPQIRKDPPRWPGESFAGCHYSETTPEYLDEIAGFNDWRADQDDKAGAKDARGRPKSYWARNDARLARGWAARLRKGWKPKAAADAAARDEDYDDGGFGDGAPTGNGEDEIAF